MTAVLEAGATVAFKDNLRAARVAAGRTQAEAAAAAGVPLRTYQSWEIGHREPRIDALAKVAAALRVTADALLAGVADPPAARGKRK